MWNQMPAKSLRQQAFAPRSGRFSGSRAARKSRHCEGCRKSPTDFFDSLKREPHGSLFYWISCSRSANSSPEKNSAREISRPSQSILTVTIDTSRRRASIMLYTVEGVTPALTANSLYVIPRWRQSDANRAVTASFTPCRSPHGYRTHFYAIEYTHLRILGNCDMIPLR